MFTSQLQNSSFPPLLRECRWTQIACLNQGETVRSQDERYIGPIFSVNDWIWTWISPVRPVQKSVEKMPCAFSVGVSHLRECIPLSVTTRMSMFGLLYCHCHHLIRLELNAAQFTDVEIHCSMFKYASFDKECYSNFWDSLKRMTSFTPGTQLETIAKVDQAKLVLLSLNLHRIKSNSHDVTISFNA
jgi:hypothetical protein